MFSWSLISLAALFFASTESVFIATLVMVMVASLVSLSFLKTGLSWVSVALVLLYLGGMLILFLYMASLTTSAKLEASSLSSRLFIGSLLLVMYFWQDLAPFSFSSNATINSIFSGKGEAILLFLASYLVLGLYISVVILEKFKGPLMMFLPCPPKP